MDMEDRIKKDIEMFEKNIKKIKNKRIKDMATRYYEDAKYYLDKGDLFTSFGCINYAHGLIDSVLNRKAKVVEIAGCAGCGKTRVLEFIVDSLRIDYEILTIIINFSGNEDCKRIEKYGIKTICINTGNKCLNEELLENAIEEIEEDVDYIFVENAGSLTCSFINPMNKKLLVVSPNKNLLKFPLPFQTADFIVVTGKNADFENELKKLTNAEMVEIDIEDGKGIERILEWLKK